MAATIPLVFYNAQSDPGSSSAAYVDIPSPPSEKIAVIRKIEAFIRTSNGRRKISAKDVVVERYEAGVEGADRNNATALTSFSVPISSRLAKEVDYREENPRYTSIIGLDQIQGRGFRVMLNDKDRASDFQRISIAVEVLNKDNLY